jgi:hypothetical protein
MEPSQEKIDILSPIIHRYHRMLWIPDEAIAKIVAAMNNMMTDGMIFEDLPEVFLFPITVDMDSSPQTGDSRFKNLIAFNDYGLLLASQITENFQFTKDFPKWKNAFARFGNLTNLSLKKDYPIFVPHDVILCAAFADLAKKEIFDKQCGILAGDSILLSSFADYSKSIKATPTEVIQPIVD